MRQIFKLNTTSFLWLVITTLALAACNNAGSDKTANADTLATKTDAPAGQDSMAQSATGKGGDLMSSMNEMMARMQSKQLSGDFDADFANMMIEHHQGGIDMAQIELASGKDENMRNKAQEISAKQQKEIQELRNFIGNYKNSGMKHGEGELQRSMSEMKRKMQSMSMTNNIDKDFATMMRSHHQDGIAMSKLQLQHGMSDELKKMAQKGIDEQQKDIRDFDAWLSAHK